MTTKSTTAQHTPTPFCFYCRPDTTGFTHVIYDERTAGNDPDPAGHIAEVFGQGHPQDNRNAAFIVKACNLHDELLEVLDAEDTFLTSVIEHAENDLKTFPKYILADALRRRKVIRAALAKANAE